MTNRPYGVRRTCEAKAVASFVWSQRRITWCGPADVTFCDVDVLISMRQRDRSCPAACPTRNSTFMTWPEIICSAATQRLLRCCLAAALMIGALPFAVCAQDPPGPAADADKPGEKPDPVVRPHDTVILIDSETGLPVKVPAGATSDAFLAAVRNGNAIQNDGLPAFSISNVLLEGEVVHSKNGNRTTALLKVTISVQVPRDEAAVRVPLRLNEATLRRYSHDGDGSAVVLLATERGQGLTCQLKGKGSYQFELEVSVPVRTTGGANRLQLSLPASVQSFLRLTVPGQWINVPNDDLDVELESLPDAKTELQVHGFGSTLDLGWQVAAAPGVSKTELVTQTAQSAELSVGSAFIDAVQTITTNETYDSFDVHPPSGYSFVSVSSPTHRGVQIENAEARPLRVLFSTNATGTIELRWEFKAEASGSNEYVELGGLRLQGATRRENRLGVSVADGFRLQRFDVRTRDADQIPAGRFRSFGDVRLNTEGKIDEAWRLLSDNARVAYSVSRITPNFRVLPTYDLTFRETRAELVMFLDVQVFNGSLDRIPLQWPGFQGESWQQIEVFGWRRAEAENPELIEISVQSSGEAADDVELVLQGGQTSTQGLMEVELRCSRPLVADGGSFPISIPGVDVLPIPIGTLTTSNAPSIQSILEVHNETNARLMPRKRDDVIDARIPQNQRERNWELNSTRLEFTATVDQRQQQIVTASTAQLELSRDRIDVRQSLGYTVSFEPLTAVRVTVPLRVIDAQNASFRLHLPGDPPEADQELTPLQAGLDEVDGREFRLQLPDALWGEFEIEASYSLPLNGSSGVVSTTVPLVRSKDAPPGFTRLNVTRPTSIDVQVADPAWRAELNPGVSESWMAEQAPSAVPIDVTISRGQATERFSIERAAVKSVLQPAGIRTEAVYILSGQPRSLEMRLPAEADRDSLRIWWNGDLLSDVQFSDEAAERLQLQFDEVPEQTTHLLAISYQTPLADSFAAINDFTLSAPAFASDVWIAETRWTTSLPLGHHAFVYPDNYAPRFRWRRNGAIWARQSSQPAVNLRRWLLSGPASLIQQPDAATVDRLSAAMQRIPFHPLQASVEENAYRFGAFGHQHTLALRTISVPAIAVLGSGVSLLIGFVLLRIPVTRNIVSFGVLAFGMALAGLWQLEAVQLLIQPALLGFAVAGVASLIDGWRRREPSRTPLVDPGTQSIVEDFLPSGPGSSQVDLRQEPSDPSQPATV